MLGRTLVIAGLAIIAFVAFQRYCGLDSGRTYSPPILHSKIENNDPSSLNKDGAVVNEGSLVSQDQDSILRSDTLDDTVSLASESAQGQGTVSESPSVERILVDFEQLNDRTESQAESRFGKSYKLVAEGVEVSSTPTVYQVNFLRGVKDVVSVIVVGQDGEVNLEAMKFNDQASKTLSAQQKLFAQDWIRSEESFAKLESMELRAQTDKSGSFNIYIQVMGDK
ncbi:MAG: hypothetical protein M9899_03040 [Bdellovibrionaceae bacterium]|nr:hypothetical protein [Pseudobdellovibrionaceae bacterium]